jgi:CelD/BcsL family acetyltransferase involved in cellulose biosynthesis
MELHVLTTLPDLEAIRPFWNSAQRHPNVDFEHFRLVCASRRMVLHPYVIVLGALEEPSALLVARLERRTFVPTIGYLAPIKVPATVLTVLHQGIIGSVSDADAEALVRQLWRALSTGQADVVEIYNLAADSALCRAIGQAGPRVWSQKNARWSNHWSLAVPEERGGLTQRMRSKHRNWLQKKQRALESAFPGAVQWRWVTHVEEPSELCAQLETVAARTYQRGLGAGFQNSDETQKRMTLFAERRQLRIQLLEIDGAVRAFWLGAVYHDVFHSWSTAYDQELRDYEPGNLMFHRLVDELADERVKTLDFGLGDAFYKQRYGDTSWREGTLRIFAPTPKGALLRSSAAVTDCLDVVGRYVLKSTGLTSQLKNRWRQRLAQRTA